jgi:flagellar biosynthetic protein FlhB
VTAVDEREEDKDDKTEEPTEERRRQFREEGKLPATKEILSAFSLIFITCIAYFFGGQIISATSAIFESTWKNIPSVLSNPSTIENDLLSALRPVALILAISALIATLSPSLVGLLLGRFNWSWKKMEFDLKKLDPIKGIANIYGKNLIFETIKSILKAVIILWVCYFFLKYEFLNSVGYMRSEPIVAFTVAGRGTMAILGAACIATLLIGAIDYAWNVFNMERELRMTKESLKKEIKQQEGDPLYKSARRRFAREVLLRSSVDKVPTATFVVTNPTHFSVAIRYASDLGAPVVVSKGQDYLALRIREIAKTHDIMIVENKALARALYKTVDIGEEVPSSLYLAVIEILKSIYRARGRGYFSRFGIAAQFG